MKQYPGQCVCHDQKFRYQHSQNGAEVNWFIIFNVKICHRKVLQCLKDNCYSNPITTYKYHRAFRLDQTLF